MRKLNGYGLASLLFALVLFQRQAIRQETVQDHYPPLPHFPIENVCSRLVYFPEAPCGYQLTVALRASGLVQTPHPRTDIVWESGRFRYVNEQHHR